MTRLRRTELIDLVRRLVESLGDGGLSRTLCIEAERALKAEEAYEASLWRQSDEGCKTRKEAAQDETDDVDPFSASYQRAFVNGCDVQIERENNGTWRWHVRKSRTEPHALLDAMREIARGPAATESQAKMLALEVARSA